MWTGPTIALFIAILVGLTVLAWLALNVVPRAAAIAAEMRERAAGRRAGAAAYIACWVLLFPVMLSLCLGGGIVRWITELEGEEEPRAERDP